MSRRITRRAFLRGAAGAVLALPFLERDLLAQATQPPLRFVVFHHGQGMLLDSWTPQGTGAAYQLSPILAPLAPHRARINVISGLANRVRQQMRVGNGHDPAGRSILTCWPFSGIVNPDGTIMSAAQQVASGVTRGPAFGPSIDQVLARRIGGSTRMASLDLAIGRTHTGENQMLFADKDVPVTGVGDPRLAYQRITSGLSSGTPRSFRERLVARRGSVLDAVADGFGSLRARVGAADRARLDAHAEQVRELESRLAVMSGGACPQSSPPQLPAGYSNDRDASDDVSARAQIDNLVLALACDVARVASLQFTFYHAPTFPWLRQDIPGRYASWHDMIHTGQADPAARAAIIAVQTWYASQFAYLLARMAAVPEGTGTLLDHSLVLWISEFGNGGRHDTNNLPIVLAGGLGGRLATGRHLAFAGRTTGDLFVTILNLFGFPDGEFGLRRGLDGSPLVTGALAV